MEEVDKLIGIGGFSAFFRLKDHPRLGVLIKRRGFKIFHKSQLKKEFKKGLFLRKIGLSVPRYVSVIKVQIPNNISSIINSFSSDVRRNKNDRLELLEYLVPGRTYSALVVEIIDNDIKSISSDRVKSFFREEIKKLEKYRIQIGSDSHSGGLNVLWSRRKQKIYLIDFQFWKFPKGLL